MPKAVRSDGRAVLETQAVKHSSVTTYAWMCQARPSPETCTLEEQARFGTLFLLRCRSCRSFLPVLLELGHRLDEVGAMFRSPLLGPGALGLLRLQLLLLGRGGRRRRSTAAVGAHL